MKAAIADALGITVEELEAAKEDGTRLSELAEELGVDMADVEAAVQEVKEDAVNQPLQCRHSVLQLALANGCHLL